MLQRMLERVRVASSPPSCLLFTARLLPCRHLARWRPDRPRGARRGEGRAGAGGPRDPRSHGRGGGGGGGVGRVAHVRAQRPVQQDSGAAGGPRERAGAARGAEARGEQQRSARSAHTVTMVARSIEAPRLGRLNNVRELRAVLKRAASGRAAEHSSLTHRCSRGRGGSTHDH